MCEQTGGRVRSAGQLPVAFVEDCVDARDVSSSEKGSSFNLRSDDSCHTIIKKPVEHEDPSCLPIEHVQTVDDHETPREKSGNDDRETQQEKLTDNDVHTDRERTWALEKAKLEETVASLEKRLNGMTPAETRAPVVHDDSLDTLRDQMGRQGEELLITRRENKQLKGQIQHLRVASNLIAIPTQAFESEHLKRKSEELEEKVEELKKKLDEAKQSEGKTKEKLANCETKLSIINEENGSLTLRLKSALAEANRYCNFHQTIRNSIIAHQEEHIEAQNSINHLQDRLRHADMKVMQEEHTVSSLKKENKRLHQAVRVINAATDAVWPRHPPGCLVPKCDQCQQLYLQGDEACHYHPIPPLHYDKWSHLPHLMEQASEPRYYEHFYFLCCDKLSKTRPQGCSMLRAHDAGVLNLHSVLMP